MAKSIKSKKKPASKPKKSYRPTPQAVEAAREASIGNEWYKRRSKHGRDKLFASPELLWEAACEYFEYVDLNPEMQSKPMVTSIGNNLGSEVELIDVPVKQPYSLKELCLYLGCSSGYFRTFKQTQKDEGFLSVIEMIEDVVFTQQYKGSASGFFNANIISRALGLVDRQDRTSGDMPITAPVIQVVQGTSPGLAGSEEEVEKAAKKKK